MAIGGKMYMAQQARTASQGFGNRSLMNRAVFDKNVASAASFGQSLFSTTSSASEELVNLTLQNAVDRIQAAVKERNDKILASATDSGIFA